jgi:hypothetical protein
MNVYEGETKGLVREAQVHKFIVDSRQFTVLSRLFEPVGSTGVGVKEKRGG